MMTASRVTAAALVMPLVAIGFPSGGCGFPAVTDGESNAEACRRLFNHGVVCSDDPADVTPDYTFGVSLICARVPETSACYDWTAYADCVTSGTCEEYASFAAFVACEELAIRLDSNDCFPADG